MIETEDRAILSGARGAILIVVAFVAAVVIGVFLGGWSAGWGFFGSSWCLGEFFGSALGLAKLWGLVSFVGLGGTSIAYFALDRMKWGFLNVLAALSTIYVYVGLGAGEGTVWMGNAPRWRFPASLAFIAIVYVSGRAALFLTGRSPFPGRSIFIPSARGPRGHHP
jgi:hypothetical protein